ncbi:MAG: GTPase [Clostridia bacterium]|nr:GTPase [Clostridia bacterium]
MTDLDFVPFYVVCGFLESGKTTMIQSMLSDEGFSSGEKTLVICCEDGEVEYDPEMLDKYNATFCMLNSPEELTGLRLAQLDALYHPERVIMEYNSMWTMERLGQTKMPETWEYVQVITLADATTFDNYMTNMRNQMAAPMREADLILFNRCTPDFRRSYWRRQMRALNPGATILFENPDGTTDDGITDEDLPYDMKAEVISISEEQFGIFYIDAMDHPERYDGKIIQLVGQPFPGRNYPKGTYYFGRNAMTCCANDITQVGFVCKGDTPPDPNRFILLTAGCRMGMQGDQKGLFLYELAAETCKPTKEEYVTFASV